MKKLLSVVFAILFIGASYGLACEGPRCENFTAADVEAGVYTPVLNTFNYSHNPNQEDWANNFGQSGHAYDIKAKGTKFALAHGEGASNMYGIGGAFQKEIKGGELSGSWALTTSTSRASGFAYGVDSPDCDTGRDYAKVDLEVFGFAYQGNGSYSDDRQSEVGGGSWSSVDYWGQTDKTDHGTDGYWTREATGTRWLKVHGRHAGRVFEKPFNWHPHPQDRNEWRYVGLAYDWIYHSDLDAYASDSIFGTGIAGGGTLVYAKQTRTNAFVAGITGSFSTACLYGAEHTRILVNGGGGIGGVAQLPSVGYAAFSAEYGYSGYNFGMGYAGGTANVNTTQTGNSTSVTSSATAFAGSHSGGGFIIYEPQ